MKMALFWFLIGAAASFIVCLILVFAAMIIDRHYQRGWLLGGTFIAPNGTRMFFRTAIIMRGPKLPLASIQNAIKRELGGTSVCIFTATRISAMAAESIDVEDESITASIDFKGGKR